MGRKLSSGAWVGEIVQVRLRKGGDGSVDYIQQYGAAFCTIASVQIVNGVAYVEGLLNKGPTFSRKDYTSIEDIICAQLGCDKVIFYRGDELGQFQEMVRQPTKSPAPV